MDLAAKIRTIPTSPGVYLYKNAEGEVIYVGKAKNLRSRVSSYFHEGRWEDAKTGTLVREAVDVVVAPAVAQDGGREDLVVSQCAHVCQRGVLLDRANVRVSDSGVRESWSTTPRTYVSASRVCSKTSRWW